MTKSSFLAARWIAAFVGGAGLSEGTQPAGRLISEDAVRAASAELYSDILARACRNGWRYPQQPNREWLQAASGELKLQLVDQGYTDRA